MASQNTDPLALESVPHVARPVIIAAKENAARDAERDGGDTAKDVIVSECVQLAVSTDVEQPARCIIRTSSERISVREEAISPSQRSRG